MCVTAGTRVRERVSMSGSVNVSESPSVNVGVIFVRYENNIECNLSIVGD